jgi:hypothetical protein
MNHTFEFFDRAVVDHFWKFLRGLCSRRNTQIGWLQSTERVNVDSYDGKAFESY